MRRVKRSMEQSKEDTEFYRMYYGTAKYVVSNILRGVGRKEDEEECVNDALCQAMMSMDKFDKSRGSEKTYVGIIARSVALAKRKQLVKNRTMPFSEELTISYEQDFEVEYKELVQGIIKGLKPKEQELFTMHFLLQMPAVDIARRFHLTRGAVDTRINRLRKKITAQLMADPFYQYRYGNWMEKRDNVVYLEQRRKEADRYGKN